jgi:uncharacterized membrane protein (DUF2068 family)
VPDEPVPPVHPPGTERPPRFRPKLRYELIGCGLHGHELIGTDAAEIHPEDHLFVREGDNLRWYRCVRCDSWLPLPPPSAPKQRYPPPRDEIMLPLRGRPLRDRYVLRVIAVIRLLHLLALGSVAVAIFLFAQNRAALHGDYTRILNAIQGGVGGPLFDTRHNTLFRWVNRLFTLTTAQLYELGFAVTAFSALYGFEAYGLWYGRRWAEYLTFCEVSVLIPIEIYELTIRVTPLKILTFVINVAVLVYLLVVHRLFGVRGGGRAERAEHVRDTGWAALERATPSGMLTRLPG